MFSVTRRGYDTREVDALLENVAMLLERQCRAPAPRAAERAAEHPAGAEPPTPATDVDAPVPAEHGTLDGSAGGPPTLASVSVLPGQRAPAAGADPLLLGAAERVLREAWDRARRATSEAENARDRLVVEADALAGARHALEQVMQAYQRDRASLRARSTAETPPGLDTSSTIW
jgi:cell division septum initiation protein DivIVA